MGHPPQPRRPRPLHGVPVTVVDLFAGLGGWDHAARQLGLDPLGIEHNADACATREAVGLRTRQADIATLDPADFAPCEGLIASPPCQDFSVAGKGAGRTGDRGQLVDEVMRWTDALRPRWVACEQVPPVLPIWREFAHHMEQWGYRTWCGLLSSERYGVPQARERAILMASLDGPVLPPAPTHQEYRHGEPARHETGLFGEVLPWVSMAEALGWGMTERPANVLVTRASGGGSPDAALDGGSGARRMHEAERERGAWVVDRRMNSRGPGGTQVPTAMRDCDTPAPTMDTEAGSRWVLHAGNDRPHSITRPVDDPAPTIPANVGKNGGWVFERPATTIAGDPRCFAPGGHIAHDGRNNTAMTGRSENAIRLTLAEGLTLQGFPPDWPVQGTKTAQWLQVGNSFPPPVAKAILEQLI